MQQRVLGRQGLTVSALGYGAMGTAAFYGPTDDTESGTAIRRAHELGVTHFDTAELYGWGAGEKLLGRVLAPIRDQVTIATKFGFTSDFGADSRPEHVREVVDNSLRHLGIDTIDLLYQHVHDPKVPVEDVVGVMAELVDAGKVRYLGLSNTDAENIRRAHAVHPISALQAEYSIFARGTEGVLSTLEELGIGLVAYSPMARGFLTGGVRPRSEYSADDVRQRIDWWSPGNFERNVEITDALKKLAAEKGATLSQLAIAWLLAQRDYIVPIPGSRDAGRVAEHIEATDLSLTTDDLERIAGIAPDGGIGSRGVAS